MSDGGLARVRNPWMIAGGVLAALVILGLMLFSFQVVGYIQALKRGEDPLKEGRLQASVTKLLAQTPITETDLSRVEAGDNPKLGSPAAPIHIVEFLDYQCPFSKQAAGEIRLFIARHPDDVLLTVRDFPLDTIHEDAAPAAMAARCVFAQGDVNAFWRYHDLLFRNQERLKASNLRAYAAALGIDLTAFDECLARRTPEATVKTSLDDGLAAGVRGTPTFFINGIRVQGAVDLAALEAIYARLKAEKK